MRLQLLVLLAASFTMATPAIAQEIVTETESQESSTSELFIANQTSAADLGTEISADQTSFKYNLNNLENTTAETSEIAQGFGSLYTRTGGVYIGGTIGPMFTNLTNYLNTTTKEENILNTGFGGSVFVGYQFNDHWGADAEYVTIGGSLTDEADTYFKDANIYSDVTDTGYTASAVMANARYIIPIGGSENNPAKFSVFVSPGIGFGNFSIDYDQKYDQTTLTNKTVENAFALQIKAGAAYRFNYGFEAFAQLRYLAMPGVLSKDITGTEDKTFSSFSPEFGVRFRF
jgi:opacity protein-like surface antigen